MSYLRLYNPTSKSCDYKVRLSNDFNDDYYRELRITGQYYQKSASDIPTYVEKVRARNSDSKSVYGEIDNGMSAGSTYTLYAYAQARNKRWYLAGQDTITMKGNTGKADLRIESITPPSTLEAKKDSIFKVVVKNRGQWKSTSYYVEVYHDGDKISRDRKSPLSPGSSSTAELYVRMPDGGTKELEFRIRGGESKDRRESGTYTWIDNTAFNLSISARPMKGEPFERGEKTPFQVEIKNHRNLTSPKFKIKVTDITHDRGANLPIAITDYLTVPSNAVSTFHMNFDCGEIGPVGRRNLKFEIIPESGYTNLSPDDDCTTPSYVWVNNVPDDLTSKIFQRAKKTIMDDDTFLQEVCSKREHSPRLRNVLRELRYEVAKETKGDSTDGVVGMILEVGGHHILGGGVGAGIYIDGYNTLLVAPEFSAGVSFAIKSKLGVSITFVVFPFAKNIDAVKGLGVTLGVDFRNLNISITNLDPETYCLAWDILDFNFKDPIGITDFGAHIQLASVMDKKGYSISPGEDSEFVYRMKREGVIE